MEQLARGEKLSFGPFEFDNRELSYKSCVVPWFEVRNIKREFIKERSIFRVRTEIGKIVVRIKGESENWAEVLVSEVPNDRLFLKLTNQLFGSSGQIS